MTLPHERLAASLADRYRIERRPDGSLSLLGRGGTATVYLAHDLRHDRHVALKIVHPELAISVGAERFLREIHFIARLSHPHILPLFDSGEAEGLLYYVMPYLQGGSLRRQLDNQGRLPIPAAIRIVREVALALDHAHRQGVIHRDIKPENILFEDDQAVVADFGIATAVEAAGDDRLTESGRAIGTPAYMSPEQAGGADAIDGRSDIYSLGCVLYEMLGGQPPFTGPTPQAVMAQQVIAPLPPVRSRRSEVTEPVARVLTRALAKEPGDRFATASEFTAALESAGSTSRPSDSTRRRRLLVAAGVLTVAALAAAVALANRGETPVETPTIAVLPFQNLGAPEDGYFAEGITEEITSRLAMLPRLGVISRTSANQYRGTGKPLKTIGRELGADFVLEGSVRWEKPPGGSSRVRITPQLIRVSDDRHLWAGQYDETIEQVFQVQSRVAERVASALELALQEPDRQALAAQPTASLRAYDFYLRGNDYFTRAGDPAGIRMAEEMYTKATEMDPAFALAFARLARVHIWQFHILSDRTEARLARARSAADSALRLQPRLPEAHLALGQIHYWGELDYQQALREFRIAQAGGPGNGDLAWARGLVERRLGQWEQAAADLRRAVDLDPRSAVKNLDLFELYLRRREYAEAERYLDRALELEPDSPVYIYKALLIVARDGDLGKAAGALKEGISRAGIEAVVFWAPQFDVGAAVWQELDSTAQAAVDRLSLDRFGSDSGGYYLAKARARRYRGDVRGGRVYFDSAAKVLEGRTRARPDDPTLHASLALAYAGLGRRDGAIREGRLAVEMRPSAKDTWYGVDMLRNLAVVYATLGEADSAVKQLRVLLSVPSWISVPWLRADPTWDPVRRDPGFQALIKNAK
jgi:TolB-like protein/Flp pilus assembly protein TadD/tRNA A-37 threonylcarbamoyl transferase component Bud32